MDKIKYQSYELDHETEEAVLLNSKGEEVDRVNIGELLTIYLRDSDLHEEEQTNNLLTKGGEMVTKTDVSKANVGSKQGWAFSVYYDNRPYPNFTSSLVKTEKGAQRNLKKYLETGKFSFYGNAE